MGGKTECGLVMRKKSGTFSFPFWHLSFAWAHLHSFRKFGRVGNGVFICHLFFLALPEHSTSNYFNPSSCYFFPHLVFWPELQIYVYRKKSLQRFKPLLLLLSLSFISLSLNHMGKGNDKREGKGSLIRDPFLATYFWWGVGTGEIYIGLWDLIMGNRFVSISSWTTEGSYSPIWYHTQICETGCLVISHVSSFPPGKWAAVTMDKTDAWHIGQKNTIWWYYLINF